jgi:hypothetical protein
MAATKTKISDLPIAPFIIWYIGSHGKAYVKEILDAYNNARATSSSKRQMKYSSFRTIVWNLKRDGYIMSVGRSGYGDNPFDKSYYSLTNKKYEIKVRGRPRDDGR